MNVGLHTSAARPALIRTLNEQSLLERIRRSGPVSRSELGRLSGLSKPTVASALGTLEDSGLIRQAGRRTGVPGPQAMMYELQPEAGFVLALDVGREYLRGAVADLGETVRAKRSTRSRAEHRPQRLAEILQLAGELCAEAGIARADLTQTVIGSPGVYDPTRDSLFLTGGLAGWDRPAVLAELRDAFGPGLVVCNDVDAAALSELNHGHGREFDTFAFVSIGTGVGMGLVIDGTLHQGAHGAAGEIGYLPFGGEQADPSQERDAKRRGSFESVASAAGVVRSARAAGMKGPVTARRVFEAAAAGDERAVAAVAAEARLVAKAICAVTNVVDPPLVVLGGGIGQAPGFADSVAAELRRLTPVMPEIRVSVLGTDAVVDGCLAAGSTLAWQSVVTALAAG